MGHVRYLISITQPDDVGKVVLDDTEVIPVVIDVRGQQQRIAPPDDSLLAEVRGSPVDFQRELISFHDLGRLGESFAELGQKCEITVRLGAIIDERGVGELAVAQLGGPINERQSALIIPLLCASGGRRQAEQRGETRGRERRD